MSARKAGARGKEASFEEALARLESIADELESGELSLEKSLALFEEGVGIARRLEGQLAAAETRVEELTRRARTALAEEGDEEFAEGEEE